MLDRLNTLIHGPAEMPELYITQRVIDKMAVAAAEYVEDETGEAMIGVVMNDSASDSRRIYILDTIAPLDDPVREAHTFQQGGDWQGDIFQWLRENWNVARQQKTENFVNAKIQLDAQLYSFGDWHKQPGFMIQPSGGDLQTAIELLYQPSYKLGFLVAPIVTIDHPPTVNDPDAQSNFLRAEQANGLMTRIDFWYIARGMVGFRPIAPKVIATEDVPRLVVYPWHLTSHTRASQEMALLQDDGMMAEILPWNTDGKLPIKVCFLTARMGKSHFVLIATPANYPFGEPVAYTMPFAGIQPDEDLYDLMARQWPLAEKVEISADWTWSSDKTLLEYVYVVEDALGWRENPLTGDDETTDESDEEASES